MVVRSGSADDNAFGAGAGGRLLSSQRVIALPTPPRDAVSGDASSSSASNSFGQGVIANILNRVVDQANTTAATAATQGATMPETTQPLHNYGDNSGDGIPLSYDPSITGQGWTPLANYNGSTADILPPLRYAGGSTGQTYSGGGGATYQPAYNGGDNTAQTIQDIARTGVHTLYDVRQINQGNPPVFYAQGGGGGGTYAGDGSGDQTGGDPNANGATPPATTAAPLFDWTQLFNFQRREPYIAATVIVAGGLLIYWMARKGSRK